MTSRVLLLHSGITDARSWDPLMLRMEDEARLVALDFPFHHPVAHVLEEVRREPCVLVGNSFGGLVALDVAGRVPEQVDALLLLAPPPYDEDPSPELRAFDERETELAEAGDIAAAVELNLDVWIGDDQALRETVRPMCHAALLRQIEDFEPDFSEPMAPVSCPVGIMVGDADLPDFMARAERLARELPGASLEVVPGARHLIAMERPDAVAEALRRLLR